MTQVYHHEFTVNEGILDENGHVNNIVYVQWMQDVAIPHSDVQGHTAAREVMVRWETG
jgi:acyl-CoA thioester hydrolase